MVFTEDFNRLNLFKGLFLIFLYTPDISGQKMKRNGGAKEGFRGLSL